MIKVSTKKMQNGKWVCYTTINGYDHSFEGAGINAVQIQMADLISKLFSIDRPKIISNDPIIFPKQEPNKKENYITYAKSRIDNNPFG